jgi:hypothetical protein
MHAEMYVGPSFNLGSVGEMPELKLGPTYLQDLATLRP